MLQTRIIKPNGMDTSKHVVPSAGATVTSPKKVSSPSTVVSKKANLFVNSSTSASTATVASVALIWNLSTNEATQVGNSCYGKDFFRVSFAHPDETKPLFASAAKLFTVTPDQNLLSFLKRHDGLVQLLLDAEQAIRQFFPSEKLSLDLVSIPDEENTEHMVIKIWADTDVDDAINRRDKLDEAWWSEHFCKFGDYLSIRLAF